MIDVSPLTHQMAQTQPAPLDHPRPVAPVQPAASAQGAQSGGARDSGKHLEQDSPRYSAVQIRDSSLQFRIDKDYERLVVSLLDSEGELIRQVPAELILRIAQRLEQVLDEGKLGLDERA